jgi:hypothetical protein
MLRPVQEVLPSEVRAYLESLGGLEAVQKGVAQALGKKGVVLQPQQLGQPAPRVPVEGDKSIPCRSGQYTVALAADRLAPCPAPTCLSAHRDARQHATSDRRACWYLECQSAAYRGQEHSDNQRAALRQQCAAPGEHHRQRAQRGLLFALLPLAWLQLHLHVRHRRVRDSHGDQGETCFSI